MPLICIVFTQPPGAQYILELSPQSVEDGDYQTPHLPTTLTCDTCPQSWVWPAHCPSLPPCLPGHSHWCGPSHWRSCPSAAAWTAWGCPRCGWCPCSPACCWWCRRRTCCSRRPLSTELSGLTAPHHAGRERSDTALSLRDQYWAKHILNLKCSSHFIFYSNHSSW